MPVLSRFVRVRSCSGRAPPLPLGCGAWHHRHLSIHMPWKLATSEEEREQRCEGRATRRGWPEQMVIEIGLAMVEEDRKREEVGNDEWGSHVTLPETVRLPCAQRFVVEKFAIFSTLVSLIEFLGD